MASKRSNTRSSGNPNQKLPMNKTIPLGIQHVLAMFAGNITVPIIVAGVFGQTPEQKTRPAPRLALNQIKLGALRGALFVSDLRSSGLPAARVFGER